MGMMQDDDLAKHNIPYKQVIFAHSLKDASDFEKKLNKQIKDIFDQVNALPKDSKNPRTKVALPFIGGGSYRPSSIQLETYMKLFLNAVFEHKNDLDVVLH